MRARNDVISDNFIKILKNLLLMNVTKKSIQQTKKKIINLK